MWLLQQRAEAFPAACALLVADGWPGWRSSQVGVCSSERAPCLLGLIGATPQGWGSGEWTFLRARRVGDEPSQSAGGVVRAFLRVEVLIIFTGSKRGG